jgi:hypothetical protein
MTNTTPAATARMIARRVRGGYNEAESIALLAELTASHTGDNLDAALAYNGFTK